MNIVLNMKKRLLRLVIAAQVFLMTSAAPWEGVSSIAPSGVLPERGYYAATNTFPNDTVIDVMNLETGRGIQVIVKNSANVPGGMILLSREAADAVGMRANAVSRLRANQPGDVASYSRTSEARPYAQGDPDFDPRAAIQSYALPQDFSYSGPYPYSPYPDVPPYAAPYSNMAAANNPPPYNILPDRIAPETAAPPMIVSAPPPPVEPVVIVMPPPVAIEAVPEIRVAEAPKETPRQEAVVKPESAPQVSAPAFIADSPNVVPSYPPLYDRPYNFAGASPLAREFVPEPSIPAPALSERPSQTEAPLQPEAPDYPSVISDWSPRYESPLAFGNSVPGLREFPPEPAAPRMAERAPASEQLAAPDAPFMMFPAERTPSVPPAANLADAAPVFPDTPDTVQSFMPDPEKLPARASIPSPEIEHYLTEPVLSQNDFIEQKPEATANDYPELYYDNTYAWAPAPEIRTDDNGSSYMNVMPPETAWLNAGEASLGIGQVPEPQILGYGPEVTARPDAAPDTIDVFQTPNEDPVVYALSAPRLNPAAEAPLPDAPQMAYAPPVEEMVPPVDFPDTVSVWNDPSERGTGIPEAPAISSYPFESAPAAGSGFTEWPDTIEKTPAPYSQNQGITESPYIESYPYETIEESAVLAERPPESLDFPEVFPHFASPSYTDRPYLENPDVKTYTPDEAYVESIDLPPYSFVDSQPDNPEAVSGDIPPFESRDFLMTNPGIQSYNPDERTAAVPEPALYGNDFPEVAYETPFPYDQRASEPADIPNIAQYPYEQNLAEPALDTPEVSRSIGEPLEKTNPYLWTPSIDQYPVSEAVPQTPEPVVFEEGVTEIAEAPDAVQGLSSPFESGVGAPFPPEIQQYRPSDAAPDNADAARFYDTPERGIGGLWEEPRLTENAADALASDGQSPAADTAAWADEANVSGGFDNPQEGGIAELYGPTPRSYADSFYEEPETFGIAGDPDSSNYYGLNEPGISEARADGAAGGNAGVAERGFQPEEIAEATFSPQNPFDRETAGAYEPAINGYDGGVDNADAAGAYTNPADAAVGDLVPPALNEYGLENPAASLAAAPDSYAPPQELPQVESLVRNPDEGGVGIAPDPAYFYDNPDALAGVSNPKEAGITNLPYPAITNAPPEYGELPEAGMEDNLDALAGINNPQEAGIASLPYPGITGASPDYDYLDEYTEWEDNPNALTGVTNPNEAGVENLHAPGITGVSPDDYPAYSEWADDANALAGITNPDEAELSGIHTPGITGVSPDDYPAYNEWADDANALAGITNPDEAGLSGIHTPGITGVSPDDYPAYSEWVDNASALAGITNPDEAGVSNLHAPGITGVEPDGYPVYSGEEDYANALPGITNPDEAGVANLHAPGIAGMQSEDYPAYSGGEDDVNALSGITNPDEAGVSNIHAPGITGVEPDSYPAYSEWADDPNALAGITNPDEAGVENLHSPGITGVEPDGYPAYSGGEEAPDALFANANPGEASVGDFLVPGVNEYDAQPPGALSYESPAVTGPVGDPIESDTRELWPPAWNEYSADSKEAAAPSAADALQAAQSDLENPDTALSRADPSEDAELYPAAPGITLYDTESDNPDTEHAFTEPLASENALPVDPPFLFDDPEALAGQANPAGGGVGDMPYPGMTEYATDLGAKTDETAEALNSSFGEAEGELAGMPYPGTREYDAEDDAEALGGYDNEYDFMLGELPYPQIGQAQEAGTDEGATGERGGEGAPEDDVEVLGAFPNGRESEIGEMAYPFLNEWSAEGEDEAGIVAAHEIPLEYQPGAPDTPVLTEFTPQDDADVVPGYSDWDDIGIEGLAHPEIAESFADEGGIDTPEALAKLAASEEGLAAEFYDPAMAEAFPGNGADTPDALARLAAAEQGLDAELYDPEMTEAFSGDDTDTPQAWGRLSATEQGLTAEFYDPEMPEMAEAFSGNDTDTPEASPWLAAGEPGLTAEFYDPEMAEAFSGDYADMPESSWLARGEPGLTAEFYDPEMAEAFSGDYTDTPEALGSLAAGESGLTAEFYDPEIAENAATDNADFAGGAESGETGLGEEALPQSAAAASDTPDAAPFEGAPQAAEISAGEPEFYTEISPESAEALGPYDGLDDGEWDQLFPPEMADYGFPENPEAVSDFANRDVEESFGTMLPAYDGVETLAFDDKPDTSDIGELAVPDGRYMLPDNADALTPPRAPSESGIGELAVPPDMAYPFLDTASDTAETVPALDEPGEYGIAGLPGPATTEYAVGDSAEALAGAGDMYEDEPYGMPSPLFAGGAPQDGVEALESANALPDLNYSDYSEAEDAIARGDGEQDGVENNGAEAIAGTGAGEAGIASSPEAVSNAALEKAFDDAAEALNNYDNGFEVEIVEVLNPDMPERDAWEGPETTAGFGPLDIDDTMLGWPLNEYPLYDGVEVSAGENVPDGLSEPGIEDLPYPAYTRQTANGIADANRDGLPFAAGSAADGGVETASWYGDLAEDDINGMPDPFAAAAGIAPNGGSTDDSNGDIEAVNGYGSAAEDGINGMLDPSLAELAANNGADDGVEASYWYGDTAEDDINGMPDPFTAGYTAYNEADGMAASDEAEVSLWPYGLADDEIGAMPEPFADEYQTASEISDLAAAPASNAEAFEDVYFEGVYEDASMNARGNDVDAETERSAFDMMAEAINGYDDLDDDAWIDFPSPELHNFAMPHNSSETAYSEEAYNDIVEISSGFEQFDNGLTVGAEPEVDTAETFLPDTPPQDGTVALVDLPKMYERAYDRVEALPSENTPDEAVRFKEALPVYDDEIDTSPARIAPADAELAFGDFTPDPQPRIEDEYDAFYDAVLEGGGLLNDASSLDSAAETTGIENPPNNEYVELFDIDDNAETSFGERPPEGEYVELRDVERIYPPRRDDAEATDAEYSPEGEYVELRDVERIYPPRRDDAEITDAEYSPESEYVELYDVERIYPPKRDDAEATAAEYSPENEYVELYDVERIYPPKRDDAEATAAEYSPEGEYVELYDVERIYPPRRDNAEATAAEYSPEGEYIELRDVERIYPPKRDDADTTAAEYSSESEYIELRDVERVYPPRTDRADAAALPSPENAPFSATFEDSPYYPAVGEVTDERPASAGDSYEIGFDEPGYAIKKTTTIIEEEGAAGSVKTLTMVPAELRPPPHSGILYADPIPEPERREALPLITRVIPEPDYLPEGEFIQSIPAPQVILEPEIPADTLISAIPARPVIMESELIALPKIITQVIPEPERAYLCDKLPKIVRLEKGKYYLQLGIFNRKDDLDRELEGIKKNYPLVIETEGAKNEIMKLMVGPMNEGESNAVLLRVQREGFKNAFIRHDG